MAILDRVRERAAEWAQDRLGGEFVPRAEIGKLRESADEFAMFRDEAEDLAYTALNYIGGKPSEMKPRARRRLAQRSRIALMQDPLAGAEAELLANFAFGKGVTMAASEDEDVQEEIRVGWTDPINEAKLFGYEAQRHRSNEALTSSNLFPVAYPGEDGVTFGTLDADRVIDIVTDPEDEEIPLYYVVEEEIRTVWDYKSHQSIPDPNQRTTGGPDGKAVRYWKHWRNVDVVNRARKKNGKPKLEAPDAALLAEGLVEHFAINRVGRSLFGTPRWARTLRFYSAMNILTESHVEMAQAASTFIAQRSMTGTPEAIQRAASNVLAQTGEIGAARFGSGQPPADLIADGTIPVNPGSFMDTNESAKVESLSLNSGAGQMAQTAQIVRAPIAAASSFGQHYLGDASDANLATATSLELPTTFAVQAWQRTHESVQGWATDMILNNAMRNGRLDDAMDRWLEDQIKSAEEDWDAPEQEPDEDDAAFEARVAEAREEAGIDERTEADVERERDELRFAVMRDGHRFPYRLSYPYPGRRNLPDIVTAVTTLRTTFNAQGSNIEMDRDLLVWFARDAMMLDDPQGAVDRWLPVEAGDAVVRNAMSSTGQQIDARAGGVGPDGQPLVPPGQPGGPAMGGGDPAAGGGGGEIPANVKGIFEMLADLGPEDAEIVMREVFQPASDALERSGGDGGDSGD